MLLMKYHTDSVSFLNPLQQKIVRKDGGTSKIPIKKDKRKGRELDLLLPVKGKDGHWPIC